MMRDSLRDGYRACRADPWTTLAIVVTLGLGTGINAAVLALAYGILFRPLPYRDAAALVSIEHEMRLAKFETLGTRLQSVQSLAAYAPASHVLRGIGAPRVVKAAFVSDNFFEVLGIPVPAVARAGTAASVGVFLSERTARLLDLPPQSLVGQPVSVAGLTFPVLAVLPADVAFPVEGTELWIPASAAPPVTIKDKEDARWFKLVARMRPGVTASQVSADATRALALDPPDGPRPRQDRQPVDVHPLRDSLYGDSRAVLSAFAAASAIVLLVACANVSTLLLGRAAGREQELALRLALGAGRRRVVAIVFAEGLLLAAAGSGLGVGLAAIAIRVIRSTAASGLPRLDAVAVDWPVLLMAIGTGAIVSIICTAGPALWLRRTEAASLVRAPSIRGLAGRRRLSSSVVIAQIALATVLTVSSALLARSVVRLLAVDIGVDPGHAVSMRVMLTDTMRLAPEREAFVATMLDRVRTTPGVLSAGIGTGLPPEHGEIEMAIRLVDDQRDVTYRMNMLAVSPGFLEALGTRIVGGRTIQPSDDGSGPVVVISKSLAEGLFPGREAIGRELPSRGLGSDQRHPRIIGVVDDVHYKGLEVAAGGALYMPWAQLPLGVVSLVVRTAEDPKYTVPAIRRVLAGLDPMLAIENVRPLDELAAHSMEERRLQTVVAVGFASLTLLLSVLGLVAGLMRAVRERRHELAIRAALGGTPRQIGREVLVRGTTLVVAGVVLGIAAGLASTRLLAHALYGVGASDPATFTGVAAGILIVTSVASLVPAVRAARINPATLLRS